MLLLLLRRAAQRSFQHVPRCVPCCPASRDAKASRARWEENSKGSTKWRQLEHKGPCFAPAYEPLPDGVHLLYDGKPVRLSLAAEEVAIFYGKMLHHEYVTKEVFQKNFFNDWRQEMTVEERRLITHLDKCDFTEIHRYFMDRAEARRALPREQKQKLKEKAEKLRQEFGYCVLDGHREKVGNFKIEPPGLFRGRGDHPKMGMLKRRVMPEDVVINCSRDSKIPEPPAGHQWKEVRSDNTVTWLATWTENVQNSSKYIMLNPSSRLKAEKDWQKYEVARRLKRVVHEIRAQYRADWKSPELKKRQRAVALYFIDKVFRNLQQFVENKDSADHLFDTLTTSSLNKHLQNLMDGLTAKVFRTFNASVTLQEQLRALTRAEDSLAAKVLAYNRASRAVAILCNHQRAAPKTFEKSIEKLRTKMEAKKAQVLEAQVLLEKAEADLQMGGDSKSASFLQKQRRLQRLEEQLSRLCMQVTDREENKQVALGTAKLNYLDPRISLAWCKRFGVPVEKIYTKTQREKFAWAFDKADEDFEF